MAFEHLELLILDRLLEAQVCMRRLKVRGVRPGQPSTFWPEGTQDSDERWHVVLAKLLQGDKLDDPLKSRPSPPSAAAIARMEETWEWMGWIENEDSRKALALKVFACVYKVSTSKLARAEGINRVTLNRRFNRALYELMIKVCKERQLPDTADEDLVHQFRPKSAIQNSNIAASAA